MKELIINGKVVKGIWKTEKSGADNENQNKVRHRQAYRDPTAKAAIDNILRDEREIAKRKKQSQENCKLRT